MHSLSVSDFAMQYNLWCLILLLISVHGSTSESPRSCFAGDGALRHDCGYPGIVQADCEASGCCWDEMPDSGAPQCFFAQGVTFPMLGVGVVPTEEHLVDQIRQAKAKPNDMSDQQEDSFWMHSAADFFSLDDTEDLCYGQCLKDMKSNSQCSQSQTCSEGKLDYFRHWLWRSPVPLSSIPEHHRMHSSRMRDHGVDEMKTSLAHALYDETIPRLPSDRTGNMDHVNVNNSNGVVLSEKTSNGNGDDSVAESVRLVVVGDSLSRFFADGLEYLLLEPEDETLASDGPQSPSLSASRLAHTELVYESLPFLVDSDLTSQTDFVRWLKASASERLDMENADCARIRMNTNSTSRLSAILGGPTGQSSSSMSMSTINNVAQYSRQVVVLGISSAWWAPFEAVTVHKDTDSTDGSFANESREGTDESFIFRLRGVSNIDQALQKFRQTMTAVIDTIQSFANDTLVPHTFVFMSPTASHFSTATGFCNVDRVRESPCRSMSSMSGEIDGRDGEYHHHRRHHHHGHATDMGMGGGMYNVNRRQRQRPLETLRGSDPQSHWQALNFTYALRDMAAEIIAAHNGNANANDNANDNANGKPAMLKFLDVTTMTASRPDAIWGYRPRDEVKFAYDCAHYHPASGMSMAMVSQFIDVLLSDARLELH